MKKASIKVISSDRYLLRVVSTVATVMLLKMIKGRNLTAVSLLI